jgi:hypothetical protein
MLVSTILESSYSNIKHEILKKIYITVAVHTSSYRMPVSHIKAEKF